MTLLTIEEAAEILAQLTGRPTTRKSFKHILIAGAERRLRIYWRNSDQRFSLLFGFTGEVTDSSEAVRAMQVSPRDLGRLETRDEIGVSMFEPTDDDLLQLQKLQSVDEDGDPCGSRVLTDGEARITCAALFLHAEEVRGLAMKQVSIEAGEPRRLTRASSLSSRC